MAERDLNGEAYMLSPLGNATSLEHQILQGHVGDLLATGITHVDGRQVTTFDDLQRVLRRQQPTDPSSQA